MASRVHARTCYQGGLSYTLFVAQGSNPVFDCKIYGKGVQKVYDRTVKGYVYSCSGGATSKLQLPKDDSRAGLQLVHPFLVFQVFVPLGQHFSVELRVSDSSNTRRKMYFSTSFSDIKSTSLHCQIPISMIIREKWLSLAFHVADLFTHCFRGATFRSVDVIVLGPTCKLRKIFTMRNRLAEAHPRVFFEEETSDEGLPQEHMFQVGVDSCIQVFDMESVQSAVTGMSNANPTEDSRTGGAKDLRLRARRLTLGKVDGSRQVHVAFGTRMPLPLSTVQIDVNLPGDKCLASAPPLPKERHILRTSQSLNESCVGEPRESKQCQFAVNRTAITPVDKEVQREWKKLDAVPADYKLLMGTRVGQVGGMGPTCKKKSAIEDAGQAALIQTDAEIVAEATQEPGDRTIFPPPTVATPEAGVVTCGSQVAVDTTVRRQTAAIESRHNLAKLQKLTKKREEPIGKREIQALTQTKNARKEYIHSKYMDSPPGSPPCGWVNFDKGDSTKELPFNEQLLEGTWIHNRVNECPEAKELYSLADRVMCTSQTIDNENSGRLRRFESEFVGYDADRHMLEFPTNISARDGQATKYLQNDNVCTLSIPTLEDRAMSQGDVGGDYGHMFGPPNGGMMSSDDFSERQSWSSTSSVIPDDDNTSISLEIPHFFLRGAQTPTAVEPGHSTHTNVLQTYCLGDEQVQPNGSLEHHLMETRKDSVGYNYPTVVQGRPVDSSPTSTLAHIKGRRDINSSKATSQNSSAEHGTSLTSSSGQSLGSMYQQSLMSKHDNNHHVEDGKMVTDQHEDGDGKTEEPEKDLDLLYDPTLDCYYDPKTNRYYELK